MRLGVRTWWVLSTCYISFVSCQLHVINKCCPQHQIFDSSFSYCVNITSNPDDLHWFPVGLVVNATTLEKHDITWSTFQDRFTTVYASTPECETDHLEETGYLPVRNSPEKFHFLLRDDYSMEVHVSGTGPLQDDLLFRNSTRNSTPSQGLLRTYLMKEVCLDLHEMQGMYIHILKYCPCDRFPCIRKCCSSKHFINETLIAPDEDGCMAGTTKMADWRPDIESHPFHIVRDTFPHCISPIPIKNTIKKNGVCTRNKNKVKFFSNGSVEVNKMTFGAEEYCGDLMWFSETESFEDNLIVCGGNPLEEEEDTHARKSPWYGLFFILGGFCLLFTVLISAYLRDRRKGVHHDIALSHNVTLMIAYFAWGALLISERSLALCAVLYLIVQFTFLAAFFWLNVMCLDICMTFRRTKSVNTSGGAGRSKKFRNYCLYSWGSPLLITSITLLVEFLPEVYDNDLRPGFSCVCGFSTDSYAILIYFYGPIIILLAVNLILFIHTIIKISAAQKQIQSTLQGSESSNTGRSSLRSEKQRLLLFSKLFLLMGLPWVMEIVSWMAGGGAGLWVFTDMINVLRGVFIFVLFVCKKHTIRKLQVKLSKDFGWKYNPRNTFEMSGSSVKDDTDVTAGSRKSKVNTRQTCAIETPI